MEEKTTKKNNNKKQTAKSTAKKKTQSKKVNNVEKKSTVKKETTNKKIEKKEVKTDSKTVVKKEASENGTVTGNEMTKLIKIILAVTAIFLIFYGITILVANNKEEQQPETGDVVIQYDEILLGTLLEQPNSEYYVLVTTEDDQYTDAYSTYLSTYKTKENAIRVYNANLDSGFNSSYKGEESNTNVSNIKELKLVDSTLLKVSNKKVVAAYEGNSKIIEHLKSLIK